MQHAGKQLLCFASVLLRTSRVHLNVNISYHASNFERSERLFVCIWVYSSYWTYPSPRPQEDALCHWLRVTGGCSCHPSEPLTASSLACHSCCLSGQWGRQQVHSLQDSIIHQGVHRKLGPACLPACLPSLTVAITSVIHTHWGIMRQGRLGAGKGVENS